MNGTALLYTAVAASANIVGAAAVVSHSRWSLRALDNMVALSAGFMVSVALLDLAPDAILTHGANAAVVILIGYLLVHLTQHTLAPHFHFGEEVHHVTKMVSFSALAGLMLHTFVDGVAIASGFGELGKHGSLINAEFGSSFRISAVLTDAPFRPTPQRSFEVDSFCTSCRLCENACPPEAIGPTKQMVRGVEKWYVDFDRCLSFFNETHGCAICIAVRPWSRPGVGLNLAAKLARRTARDDETAG